MACWTLVIFSACSSGISHSNSSSRAITSSTLSKESAPRSSTKEDSFLMSASATPSCSATIFFTRASMLSIDFLRRFEPRSAKPFQSERLPRRFSSIHIHAAVHVDGRARDVAGRRRAQEEHRVGHVLHLPEAPQGHALHQLLHLGWGKRARHVGLDEAGGDAVHGDIAAADLARERLREADDSRLGGGVVRLAGIAREAYDGSHVHDAPRPRLHHAAQHRARKDEYRLEGGRL